MIGSEDRDVRGLRARYVESFGDCGEHIDHLLEYSPELVERFLDFATLPWRTGELEPKVKEFVLIAVNAATTHLNEAALRVHLRKAVECGASGAEIMEVLQLTAVLGMHCCNVGVPALREVLDSGVSGDPGTGATNVPAGREAEHREALRERFIGERGSWGAHWEALLDLSPEFLEAYLDFSTVPWRTGPLPPKVKELVYVAVNVSATHLYAPGLKVHLAKALAYGATRGELMEVFLLASTLGMHSWALGVPALAAELGAGA